jgi:hypothetical protein
MTDIKFALYQLCRLSKDALNYWLDRIIKLCNWMLRDYYVLPWPVTRKAAHRLARGVGGVCDFLRLLPRLPAYKLSGEDWTIVFVGSETGRREICHLFFKNGIDQQALGIVTLWRLSNHTQRWLANDADLVVCELSHFRLWAPRTPVSFTVPRWVQQELAIPEPPNNLIAGRAKRGLTNQIRRAQKTDFTYCFSHSKADFDHFYHDMYVPFIKSRHGDRTELASYPDLLRYFKRGGLILIKHRDQAVAGSVCHMASGICYWLESGVLEADPKLWQQGINTFQLWCNIVWGHTQGAKVFDMGTSQAWRSNGALKKKLQWGARVAQCKAIYRDWMFLARDLPTLLQEHINRLGFITPIGGKYYSVFLTGGSTAVAEVDIHQQTLAAKREGLEGLAGIMPDGQFKIYS